MAGNHEQALQRVIWRLRIQRGVSWMFAAARWSLLLSLFAAFTSAFHWISDTNAAFLFWLGVAALPVSFLVGVLQKVSKLQAASHLDASHALHNRLATSIEFSSKTERTLLEELAIQESLSHLGTLSAKKAAPFVMPAYTRHVALVVVAIVLVSLLDIKQPQAETRRMVEEAIQPLVIDKFSLEAEREKARQMLAEAEEAGDRETAEMAKKLLDLWDAVERGELTQEEALRQLAELEQKMAQAAEAKKSLEEALAALGNELSKNQQTKELAEALKKGDLEKAAQQLEALSDQLEKMSPEEREKMAKTLEQAAELAEELEQEREKQQNKEEEASEEEKERRRELDKCNSEDLTPAEKAECDKKFSEEEKEERKRELERNERELEQLRKEQEEKAEEQEKKRELDQLSKDMRKAAEEFKKKLTEEQKQAIKEASKKAAEEMKKLGKKQRSRERLSKSKQKVGDAKDLVIRSGNDGKGKSQSFRERAGGKGKKGKGQQQGQGQGQNGQGQGKGKGQQQGQDYREAGEGEEGDALMIDPNNPGKGNSAVMLPGLGEEGEGQGQGQGQGEGKGGDSYGEGHIDDPFGEETSLEGAQFEEKQLSGAKGKGPSQVQVIGRVAQEGLVGTSYKKVYKEAVREAEESLEREKVPVGYKRFVKRYFDLIQPQ